jgi:lipoate---protein ligase
VKTWRLLDTPPMTAAENMALDDVLVELKGRVKTPDTIHFLQFSPRAVLTGYHQSVAEEIRTDFCRANGIEINRRITGGGAIFFDENQLGWEVICSKTFFNAKIPNNRLFKTLCKPVISALGRLGLESSFRPRNDIEINGRKISGTGGTDSDDAFLFQGTMLIDFDVDTMLKSLRIPVEKLKSKEIDSIKERVTCLKWELGHVPALENIKTAIKTGFETELDIKLVPGGLTLEEEKLFEKKLPYYQSDEWIHFVRPKFKQKEVIQTAYKSEAGMVRFTLAINLPQKRIKDIFITGDFLSFPSRALFDLESRLRGLRLDRKKLFALVKQFFDDGFITIPGMDYRDFIKPLNQAIAKVEISKFGIPIEYCNQISVTNGTFEEIVAKKPSALLLPYCSKHIECDLRYKKGCRNCGDCTIGPAWTIGREQKMRVTCVTSFEDLIRELIRLKSKGATAFIGCCCQPFFSKHVDDFDRIGLPGILLNIDNTTCYELDQAKEAYAGKFDSQTEVNLKLLQTVMNVALK